MAVWVWVTLAAAAAQTIRGAGQRGLKPKLGDFGASLIRFSYAIPFAWAWIYLYGDIAGQTIPVWNQPFLFWVTIAGGDADHLYRDTGDAVLAPVLCCGDGLFQDRGDSGSHF
jgi:hypothetical protein